MSYYSCVFRFFIPWCFYIIW